MIQIGETLIKCQSFISKVNVGTNHRMIGCGIKSYRKRQGNKITQKLSLKIVNLRTKAGGQAFNVQNLDADQIGNMFTET